MSGGLLSCWKYTVIILSMRTTQFCIELEFSRQKDNGKFWAVFVYASTEDHARQQKWDYLVAARPIWGEEWFLGGGILMRSEIMKKKREGEGEQIPILTVLIGLLIAL